MDSDETRSDAPSPAAKPADGGGRKPYVKPQLVEYGDIARLTETGGPSIRDGAGKRMRKG
jgi:hypothetical protein